ncbi:MAG: hypothetical protein ABSA67_02355 [Candidatus Brocadiia bacterium]
MKRMIALVVAGSVLAAALCQAQTAPAMTLTKMDEAKQKDWLARWDKFISGVDKDYRTCDTAQDGEIAWLVTPVMEGFYNGYRATHDTRYVDMAVDWADSLIKRAVMEPDGCLGWPGQWGRTKIINAGSGVDNLNEYNTDSFISDAMVFRPIVLLAREMTTNPALKEKYGAKGESYLKLAEQLYEKWVKRGGWREIEDGGMISVVLPFGMDEANRKWIGFDTRNDPGHGFSHPDNQANEVARWMLAMWDVTGKPEYKDRAERWFKVQKSRMTPRSDGTYEIWNYWQPAGPWDYKTDHTPKHWIGVHPNDEYYGLDTAAIVAAYEHGLVFTQADIARLIATAKSTWTGSDPSAPAAGMAVWVQPGDGTAEAVNACFPNSRTSEPISTGRGSLRGTIVSVEWDAAAGKGNIVVQPKDAGAPQMTVATDKNTKVQVLRMWPDLAPYDVEIQKNFEATQRTDNWSGLAIVPYYFMLQSKLAGK